MANCENNPNHNPDNYCEHCFTCHECVEIMDHLKDKALDKKNTSIKELTQRIEKYSEFDFDQWWNEVGSAITPHQNADLKSHAERICRALFNRINRLDA